MSESDMGSNRDHHSTLEFQLLQPQPQLQLGFPAPPSNFNGGDFAAAAAADDDVVIALPAPAPVGSSSVPPVKRKRGRPRKSAATNTNTNTITTLAIFQSGGPVTQPGEASAGGTSGKRPRGRPRGSRNKKRSESEGINVTHDVITVKPGEDLAAKIMDFSLSAPRDIFILSATGSLSKATICQSSSSGERVTYEGRFEILSLTGTFSVAEDGREDSRAGALSISFSGSDGQVLGGAVAGLLIAAASVKVFLGSYKSVKQTGTAQPRFATGGQSSSPSLGSDSSGGLGSLN
ncbi:AT-hook motif nuclear-localized protein 10 [Lotus japonicus]|uniref:AT-hook motif nuclear-localized protein 10 n=1 Tax=Lotus japonicus TaxID=34305 RepID=UPI00258E149E|nr:AT-hook motif nuclear-localized protein 10 [Lotus japonicus]